MSLAKGRPAHGDGLTRTTLRLGEGLRASSIEAVLQELQRVPGVLTVDADAMNAQAIVAHDEAVPTASLVAAANRAGAAIKGITAAGTTRTSAKAGSASRRASQRGLLAVAALAAMLAVILIDIELPDRADKRWVFIVPLILVWTFILLRATLVRRP